MSSISSFSEKLSEKELAVLKKASNLIEEEIRAFHTEFRERCPTGKMTRDEFDQIWKKLNAEDTPAKLLEAAFNVFDKNNDSTIDFQEYLLTIYGMSGAAQDDIDELVFTIMNKSGDGYITYDEMVDYLTMAMVLYDENMNNHDAQNKFVKCESENFFAYLGIKEKSEKINKEQFLKTARKMLGPLRIPF